ncbi:MAG: hypothetical protein EZS28_052951, partial [Streblomastix strix]
FPIAFHNVNSGYQDFSDINGVMKKITQKRTQNISTSLTQVMENGIWDLEAQFNTTQEDGFGALGIVQDQFNIPVGCCPGNDSNTAFFCGQPWSGCAYDKTENYADGNVGFNKTN